MSHAPAADPFASLNDAQRAAVDHGRGEAAPGPLLVLAGAGTGKTTTLAARVARRVLDGADPHRLLMLTFSRRAAQEMERRVAQTLSRVLGLGAAQPIAALPWSGTFHSIGARLLREYAPSIGLSPQFTILDRSDAEDLLGWVRQELGFAATEKRFPMKGTCLSIYSRAVNARMPVGDVVAKLHPWCMGWEEELAALFRAYDEAKHRQQVLDYDDLLLAWHELMAVPELARAVSARFDHVFVDEYQDTNRLQADILHALRPDGRGVTVVGDDAQAIYSFRAAEVRNILEFAQRFDPPARVITLTRNHRSTQPVLDVSNAVIALSPRRLPKTLVSVRGDGPRPRLVHVEGEIAQARWVCDEVLAQRETGLALKRQAVLFRAGHHSAALELELTRRNVPFVKYGGLKFLEAAHVKDLLSVLRWVQNPRHRLAAMRVALLMPGMGPASARRLVDEIEAAEDPLGAMLAFTPPPSATPAWREWLRTHAALRDAGWPEAVSLARRWYAPQLERLHDDAALREADLVQLARLAAGFPNRERFLAELTLDPPAATSDEPGEPLRDEDYLILSTMHSAKGQEWSAVYVLNAVDGCIPSDMSTGSADEIEEERRLLYVALTRAKDSLAVLVPQRFHVTQQRRHGDRHLYAQLTRFIPAPVADLFDDVTPPAPGERTTPEPALLPAIDLPSRLRGRW